MGGFYEFHVDIFENSEKFRGMTLPKFLMYILAILWPHLGHYCFQIILNNFLTTLTDVANSFTFAYPPH